MDRPITALEALSMAGGLLPTANAAQAVIIRREMEAAFGRANVPE